MGRASNSVCYKVPVDQPSRKCEKTMGYLSLEPNCSELGMQNQDCTQVEVKTTAVNETIMS